MPAGRKKRWRCLRNEQRNKKGTAAFCRLLRALAASYNDDTADSYLSRIYTEAEDWISEGGAEDAFNGPGAAQTALEEDSALAGPRIHEVSMGEKYHSDYDLYEHSIDGRYFIYSNVSNGGITDRPVYVEIPVDVFCTAEKDGVPMNYTSGQLLSDRGTYVMRLTAVYDKNVPLSQQEEYRTVFRFRIDEKRQDAAGGGSARTRGGPYEEPQAPWPGR